MEIAIKVLQLILSLSILVVIHEMGHFMFAKLFKIRVEKFYLFFNPWFSLFKFKKGDTEYGLGWVPFGGYVSISGMIDESMNTEQMKEAPKPYEFRSKPAWQRLLVMTGGVLMNILLALVIYMGISYTYGESYISNKDVKCGYQYSQLAQEIGFQNGDKILTIDGKQPDNYRKIMTAILFDGVQEIEVERAGVPVKIKMNESYIPRLLKETGFLELRFPFVVGQVLPSSGAEQAGILVGDSLVSVNGQPAQFVDEYEQTLRAFKGDSVSIGLVRDSLGVKINKMLLVPVSDSAKIGAGVDASSILAFYPVTTRNFTLLESIPQGVKGTISMLDNYIKQLKLIFNPDTEAYKSVGSVIAMGNIFPAQWDWLSFWSITALFSVMLAIMNILPIPALDGGHVLFLLYEVITRRKPSDKFMEYAQMFGMILLLCILALAMGNDIYRLFK